MNKQLGISCLMITQQGKLEDIKNSIRCFNTQTHQRRELVIVHDGDNGFQQSIEQVLSSYPDINAQLHQAEGGLTLGALRNQSVDLATQELICQWDDDDFNHPERLRCQYDYLLQQHADFCFLSDQLHWYVDDDYWFWNDWSSLPLPESLIEGTLLGYRNKMGWYPQQSRGEDTALIHDLICRQNKLVALADYGYLYIYSYNGRNTWELEHHAAISREKRIDLAGLKNRQAILKKHLLEYKFDRRQFNFPHSAGILELKLEPG